MEDKKFAILGLAETRCKGQGRTTLHNNFELVFSGNVNDSHAGVAIIMEERFANHIENIRYESSRIIAVTININQQRTSFIQAYAPQQGRTAAEKEKFYEDLERVYDSVPTRSDVILMGDLNGHVGSEPVPGAVGHFGVGTRNPEGDNLVDFAIRNNLAIMNTYFKHRESHKYTWYRYNQSLGAYDLKTEIDFILTNNKALIRDVRAMPSTSLDSDHRLLKGKLKLHATPKIQHALRKRICT